MSDETQEIVAQERRKLSVFGAIAETYVYFITHLLLIIRLILPLVVVVVAFVGVCVLMFLGGDITRVSDTDAMAAMDMSGMSGAMMVLCVSLMVLFLILIFLAVLSFIVSLTRHIVLREKPSGLLPLGAPAFKFVVTAILLAIWIVILFAIVGGVLFAPLYFSGMDLDMLESGVGLGLIAVLGLLMLIVVIYLSIRYALVPTAAAAESKIGFKSGVRAIKGNYWRYIGVTILFAISFFILNAVAMQVIFAALGQEPLSAMDYMMTNGGMMGADGEINFAGLTPTVLGFQVGSSLVQFVLTMILPAVIYKRLRVTD